MSSPSPCAIWNVTVRTLQVISVKTEVEPPVPVDALRLENGGRRADRVRDLKIEPDLREELDLREVDILRRVVHRDDGPDLALDPLHLFASFQGVPSPLRLRTSKRVSFVRSW